jgi:MSHA biogenesis protein MshN
MSLINQMLKDLESRRASGDLAQRAVDGMGTAARDKQRKQNVLLLSLVIVIGILASISAYLLWQERQETTAQQAAENRVEVTATQQVAAKPVSTPVPTTAKSQPSPPAKPLVQKAPSPMSSIRETPAGMTVPEIDEEDISQSQSVKREMPVRTAPALIKKRLRPQSSEQLAEKEYQRGYALLQRGDRRGASEAWRKALRIDAKHTASRESLAILYLSQSRRIEAAEQLQKGLAIDPGNNKLALLYARMQLDAEDMSGAVKTLENAMQHQQQSGDFYAFTAAVYQRMGDYAKSIAAYQNALRQQSNQSVWWMGLGISLEGAGKNSEALTAYTEANKSGRLSLKLRQYVEGRIKALQ